LQEIGDPKKAAPRKWHILKGGQAMSNSNLRGRLVHGDNPNTEKVRPYILLGMTAVTGLVDAVSKIKET
jgi:hypothetical protein